jgi:hypothetical protein
LLERRAKYLNDYIEKMGWGEKNYPLEQLSGLHHDTIARARSAKKISADSLTKLRELLPRLP